MPRDRNQMVSDDPIFGLDADEKTGREETAEIKNERGINPEKHSKPPESSGSTSSETGDSSLDAQKISAQESRRGE